MNIISKGLNTKFFYRLAIAISLLWFLILYPYLTFREWDVNVSKYNSSGTDFLQYYSGAIVARYNLWEHLYPIEKEQIYQTQPHYEPYFNLFSPETGGKWSYYGPLGSPKNSDISSKLQEICPKLAGEWRYIYPPPLAVALSPLGHLDFDMAWRVWFALLSACLFGTGYFSSKICQEFPNPNKLAEISAILIPTIISIYNFTNTETAIYFGNVAPLIGFFISLTTFAWIKNREYTTGICLLPQLLFKGMGVPFIIMFFHNPKKLKAALSLLVVSALINIYTITNTGIDLYWKFFTVIIPKADVAQGNGLQGLILYFFGLELKTYFLVFGLVLYGILIYGYSKQKHPEHPGHQQNKSIATIAGIIATYALTNPTVWLHYFTCYVIYPFSGWIINETMKESDTHKASLSIIALLMCTFKLPYLTIPLTALLIYILHTSIKILFFDKRDHHYVFEKLPT